MDSMSDHFLVWKGMKDYSERDVSCTIYQGRSIDTKIDGDIDGVYDKLLLVTLGHLPFIPSSEHMTSRSLQESIKYFDWIDGNSSRYAVRHLVLALTLLFVGCGK